MGRLPVGGWWVDVAAALAVNAFACDHDFETPGGRLLEDYGTVLLVGHSEYWSKHQRDQLDEFVDNGGNLAIFEGNTAYWKVRWEDDGCPIRLEHGLPHPGGRRRDPAQPGDHRHRPGGPARTARQPVR